MQARAQSGTSQAYTSGTYFQFFGGLPTVTPSPDLTGSSMFAFGDSTIGASNMAGWYGEGSLGDSFYAGNGSSAASGFYSFSPSPTSGTEALGILGNGMNNQLFGIRLVNDTASTVFNSIDVSFLGELWSYGASPNGSASMSFGYQEGVDSQAALPLTNFNTDSDLSFGYSDSGHSSGPVNGSNASNQTAENGVVTLATPWMPGQSLWLVWSVSAANSSPSDPALGIQNFSFSATGSTGRDDVWDASSTSVWDTSSSNWSNGLFNNGDFVTFGNIPVTGSNVVISGTGVNPAQVTVANATGTYTISGGAIGGSGSLTVSGGGGLELSSSNAYSGGTILTSGTLFVNGGDNRLGAAPGEMIFNGGALQVLGAGLVSSRNIAVDSGGGSFDTNGFNSSTSGTLLGAGTFTKLGAGDLTISGGLGAGNSQNPILSVQAGSLTLAGAGAQYFAVPGIAGDFNGQLVLGAATIAQIAGSSSSSSPALIDGQGAIAFSGSSGILYSAGNTSASAGYLTIDTNILLNSNNSQGAFTAGIGTVTGTYGGALTINGAITGNSSLNFLGSSSDHGLILLNSASSYTGATTFNDGAYDVVRLGMDNALPTGTELAFNDASTSAGALDLNGYNQTIAGLSDTSSNATGITNTGATTSTLTVNQSFNSSYNSTIGAPQYTSLYGARTNLNVSAATLNNINLVKTGSGSLELTQALTYTGTTQINGGSLIVSGYLTGSPLVSVNASGTLAGVGGILVPAGGQVIIGSGATFAPGDTYNNGDGNYNPTGSFMIEDRGSSPSGNGTFDLQSGGTFAFTLGAQYDGGSEQDENYNQALDTQLFVQGNISLAGTLTGSLLGDFTAQPGDLFFLIINGGTNAISGAFSNAPSTNPLAPSVISLMGAGNVIYNFEVGYQGNSNDGDTGSFYDPANPGNDVVLELVAVPEPAFLPCGISGLGALGMLIAFRRRRSTRPGFR